MNKLRYAYALTFYAPIRKSRMKSYWIPLYLAIFASTLIAAPNTAPASTGSDPKKTTEKAPELAKVAILSYEDKTGTKNFAYMPSSLSEAIDESLHQKFEYATADTKKVEAVAAEVRKRNKKFDAEEAAEVCKRTGTDILIFGSFIYDNKSKEIEISTFIALSSNDKLRTLMPIRNPVDATIFQTVDKVAADILAEIAKVAEEQRAASNAAASKSNEKTKLQKMDKIVTWNDSNWTVQLSLGPNRALVSTQNANIKTQGIAQLHATRRVSGAFHIGVFSSFSGIETESNTRPITTQIDMFDAGLTGSYYWDFANRWRLGSTLGAGYFYGKYNAYQKCDTNCTSNFYESFIVKNPMFMSRLGVHFLMFSFLAIGIEGEWRLHYDSPKSIQSYAAALVITGVF